MPSICVQSVGRTGKLPRMGHVFMYGGTQDWDQRLLDKTPNLLSSCQGISFYTAGAHLFQEYGSLRTSEAWMPHKWLHNWRVIKMEYQPHFRLAGTESNSQQRTQAPGQVLGVLTTCSTVLLLLFCSVTRLVPLCAAVSANPTAHCSSHGVSTASTIPKSEDSKLFSFNLFPQPGLLHSEWNPDQIAVSDNNSTDILGGK